MLLLAFPINIIIHIKREKDCNRNERDNREKMTGGGGGGGEAKVKNNMLHSLGNLLREWGGGGGMQLNTKQRQQPKKRGEL